MCCWTGVADAVIREAAGADQGAEAAVLCDADGCLPREGEYAEEEERDFFEEKVRTRSIAQR